MDNDDRQHLARSQAWSHRIFVALVVSAFVAATLYISAAASGQDYLPDTLDLALLLGLTSVATCAFIAKKSADLRIAQLEHRDENQRLRRDLAGWAAEQYRRDVRLYSLIARCEASWRTATVREEVVTSEIRTQTNAPIVRAVATVRRPEDSLDAYARGYADGLAREPMEGSNVVPISRHC